MTKVFTTMFDPNPAGDTNGTHTHKVNGTTLGSSSWTCGSGNRTKNSTGQPNSLKFEAIFVINSIGSCTTSGTNTLRAGIETDGGTLLVRKSLNVTADGTYKITLYWNYTDSGIVNGKPIYIERLTQLSTNTSHITKNSLQ